MTRQVDKGLFITLEGIGGSGKTTAAKYLTAQLQNEGYEVILTKEPGGTPLGIELRRLLLAPQLEKEVGSLEQMLLFAADRACHLKQVIRPALAAGKIVICDRYIDSTRAYQGAEGCGRDEIEQAILLATGGQVPRLTLWFDVDPHIAERRIALNRREEPDRYDGDLNVETVKRRLFAKLAAAEPQRFRRLNADLPLDQVKAAALSEVMESIDNSSQIL